MVMDIRAVCGVSVSVFSKFKYLLLVYTMLGDK